MVQTNFSANGFTSLGTVLAEIGKGGTFAAISTAYTIDLTGGVSGASAAANLLAGSSVELTGGQVINVPAFAVTGTLITDLNFTGTVTLDNGVLNNVAVDTSGGIIVAGLFTGGVLGTAADSGDSVINSGIIQSSGAGNGIELNTGTVLNGWNGPTSAEVLGGATGVQLDAGGLVENGGTILGGSTNAAVFLASGTVLNGAFNDQVAELSGGATGVEITGAGAVVNDGEIIGGTGNAVVLGSGSVTNGQIGDTQALIEAGTAGDGVWITTGSGTVGNFASILAEGPSGVYLEAGGTVTNGSAADPQAFIAGYDQGVLVRGAGTVSNFGTIQADSVASSEAIGVWLESGGTVTNQLAASYITGFDWGVLVQASAGLVTNLGTILSANGLGVDLSAGGTVVNGASAGSAAFIDGAVDGVRIAAGSAGSGALVANDGTIIGAVGVDFKSGATAAAGTVVSDGLIEGTGGYAIEFGSGTERLVLEAGGTIVGNVLGNNGSGSSTTLELAAGTNGTLSGLSNDGGTVTDSAGSFVFSQISTIVIDAGASWTVDSPSTFDVLNNAGDLAVAGGAVSVSRTLTNTGTLSIGGQTLTAQSGVLSDQGLITVGAGGLLKVSGGGVSGAGKPDLTIGGAAAALDVTGTLAMVNSNGLPIDIGAAGQGSALINQGATVLAGTPYAADEAITVGGSAGATGLLTVSDPGSELIATGQISVGLGGEGSLLIENAASVYAGDNPVDATEGLAIGQLATASGAVTVTGPQSLLSVTGPLTIGAAGLGALAIDSGASVTTTGTATIAALATASGSSASVNDATWSIAGGLTVGAAGTGALSLANAATLSAASIDAGALTGSAGIVTLSGTNTSLSTTGSLAIGDQGSGELAVLSGANVNIGGDLDIGNGTSGSGNVDIEDPGGAVTVGGNLNIGLNGAPAVLTVGPTSSLYVDNGVINAGNFAVLNLYTAIDPLAITGGSVNQQFSGKADITQTYTAFVDNTAFNIGQGLTYTLNTPLIDGDAVFSLGSNSDTLPMTLVLNAGEVDPGVSVKFTNALDTLVIGIENLPTVAVATQTGFKYEPGKPTPAIGGFYGEIKDFQAGDTIEVQTTQAATFTLLGSLMLVLAGGDLLGTLSFDTAADAQAALSGGTLLDQVQCFAAGTRLRARQGDAGQGDAGQGDVAVETLTEGDLVWSVLRRDWVRVAWVGHRRVVCARQPRPEAMWPVRVRAGAFGEAGPARDLWLSPDHAVYVRGVLVPVKHLVNGGSIAQMERDTVDYWHVEVDRHDVLLAEGLAVESYLDTGQRCSFGDGAVVALHPAFGGMGVGDVWEMAGCAPLVMCGAELEGIKALVAAAERQTDRVYAWSGAAPDRWRAFANRPVA